MHSSSVNLKEKVQNVNNLLIQVYVIAVIKSRLLSLQFPVSTKRNDHETNTCKSGIDFILFHSEKLLLAFDSRNCCDGSSLEISDGVSA